MPTTPGLSRILIAVDFSDPSFTAARWAAEQFAPKAEIVLAHVIEPPPATRSHVMRYPSMETIVTRAHIEVQARLDELSRSIAPGRCRTEIRVGAPHDELVQLAVGTQSQMIVLGRSDLASTGWARLGPTGQRVLRTSSLPVLLVAGAANSPPRRILIAVDESDMTDDVLQWGARLAQDLSAVATIVHAAGAEAPDDDMSWLTDRLGKIPGAEKMDRRVTRDAVRPAESIIAESRATQTELIVLGSRGAGAAHQMLFGSVAESVLLSSPCPVLIVLPAADRH